jgi:predicted CXXCH cytochrome family protein
VAGICLCVAGLVIVRAYDRPPMRERAVTDLATCAECHTHEGDQTVLRSDHRCAACHQEVASRMSVSRFRHPGMVPGVVGTAACLDCHAFHGARDGFLKADPIQLCADPKCHPRALDEGSHPVGIVDPRSQKTLTCTSECHDPHGTANKYFCKAEPGRALCIRCHEDL